MSIHNQNRLNGYEALLLPNVASETGRDDIISGQCSSEGDRLDVIFGQAFGLLAAIGTAVTVSRLNRLPLSGGQVSRAGDRQLPSAPKMTFTSSHSLAFGVVFAVGVNCLAVALPPISVVGRTLRGLLISTTAGKYTFTLAWSVLVLLHVFVIACALVRASAQKPVPFQFGSMYGGISHPPSINILAMLFVITLAVCPYMWLPFVSKRGRLTLGTRVVPLFCGSDLVRVCLTPPLRVMTRAKATRNCCSTTFSNGASHERTITQPGTKSKWAVAT